MTLIELLVVLLIVGILLAIAIPTFMSVTNTATDTSAQSNLDTTLTGARVYFVQSNNTYTGLYANFGSVDTDVSLVAAGTGSTGPQVVSMDVLSGSALVITAYGPGTLDCWGLADLTSAQTTAVLGFSGPGTLYFEQRGISKSACAAAAFAGSVPAGLRTSHLGFSTVS